MGGQAASVISHNSASLNIDRSTNLENKTKHDVFDTCYISVGTLNYLKNKKCKKINLSI